MCKEVLISVRSISLNPKSSLLHLKRIFERLWECSESTYYLAKIVLKMYFWCRRILIQDITALRYISAAAVTNGHLNLDAIRIEKFRH